MRRSAIKYFQWIEPSLAVSVITIAAPTGLQQLKQ